MCCHNTDELTPKGLREYLISRISYYRRILRAERSEIMMVPHESAEKPSELYTRQGGLTRVGVLLQVILKRAGQC
ncbi:MAG: hypothetical protein UU93_C0002G0049 [Candidatus Amesbacteria bacterium GW2011_GWA2_42_12]|uniref:Uncharacterized protein n=1 Tax=Candidatus Amesbacteria bacterium GW2011_GWA2_42_12 TaxID=1618356 RepID=A0A0G1AGA6_9BACT|nr:MAG: hypothetical protein UU93_C0002G0049 [Candidatus Amesbacteria bacterium GW2011_GWA2_42_12]